MEKEVLVIVDLKEGKLEKFMGWMQSDEGMSVRKSAAHPEKTIGAVKPDKSGVMFKVCLLYTSPSPRDTRRSRMPSSA